MTFTELHHQNKPLLIANVWDAASAITAHQAGYQALGTSSAAIAAMLGYDDGEAIPFEELLVKKLRIRETAEATGHSCSQVCRIQALHRQSSASDFG